MAEADFRGARAGINRRWTAAFVGGFLLLSFVAGALIGVAGRAEVRDVTGRPPDEPADLALVLKTLPCLEAVDRRAPERLLDALQAPRLLVSFPAQTLGGRRKGMAAHYEAQFRRLIYARGLPAERFEFASELAFLVEKM